MALITHAPVTVTVTWPAEPTLKLWEAKPSITAPVLKVNKHEYSNKRKCTI
jgi:hypothetical protein